MGSPGPKKNSHLTGEGWLRLLYALLGVLLANNGVVSIEPFVAAARTLV